MTTKSRTEKKSSIIEDFFGDKHYETTISDGHDKRTGSDDDAEKSQKIASKKWNSR